MYKSINLGLIFDIEGHRALSMRPEFIDIWIFLAVHTNNAAFLKEIWQNIRISMGHFQRTVGGFVLN